MFLPKWTTIEPNVGVVVVVVVGNEGGKLVGRGEIERKRGGVWKNFWEIGGGGETIDCWPHEGKGPAASIGKGGLDSFFEFFEKQKEKKKKHEKKKPPKNDFVFKAGQVVHNNNRKEIVFSK